MGAPMGRIVVESAGDRRITREYDDAGRLLRILIEPVSRGPTADAPAVERQAPPPRAAPKPTTAPSPTAAAPVTRKEQLPVTLAEIKPPPKRAPPTPVAKPKPKGFVVVAVERVEPSAAPPPTPKPTLDETIERANETLETQKPAPPEAAPQPERAPGSARPPEREPEPARPISLDIPDLEARVDAVVAQRAQRSKAKKRAPLPVPQFAPLKREPWEDRLERVLSDA